MPVSYEQQTAALENLMQMANRTKQSIEQMNREIQRTGGNNASLTALKMQLREIEAAYRDIQQSGSNANTVRTGTTIPHGGVGTVSDRPPQSVSSSFDINSIDSAYRQAIQNYQTKLQSIGAGIESFGTIEKTMSGVVAKMKVSRPGEPMLRPADAKVFVDEIGNWGKTLRELQRMQFLNTDLGRSVVSKAQESGFGPEHFRSFTSENGGAYSIANFKKNTGGIQESKTFRVDQNGGISDAAVKRQSQSFTQGIGKDLGDLVKWSVAISAIYGPINALTEAMGQLIENESKLADVSIAVNEQVANTGEIFDDVYDSAKQSGEGVTGVIDAFGQAYQAAGRVENEFERYSTAIKLTNDALQLSKLSTLDQAQAIDVLTAALSQSGEAHDTDAQKLSRGTDLLDKWVRVSKVASVDIETLATGVAVLGDSAETAGLSMEQLNALIATVSETSLAGGKEAANIAKALVGNYQQDSAVKELNRLGIAVTDTTGKTRQFLDVMNDVAALRKSGILGNEDFSRLTLALGGGGTRRQADVSRFIENYDRMQQIVDLQSDSGGEAQSALAKKLETVQTASTRLGNAFTSLAQSMGDEGGLLATFTTLLNTGTSIVEVFDSIASAVGKVGPLLIAAGAASLLTRGTDVTASLANNITGPLANYLGDRGEGAGIGMAQWMTGQRNILGGRRGAGALGGLGTAPTLGAIALPAIQNFAGGDTEEGVGNIAGGILGALATGGSPIGALIGSAIAESFVRSTLTYDTQFKDFFAGVIKPPEEGGATQTAKSLDDLMNDAFKEIGGGSVGGGKLVAKLALINSQQERTPYGTRRDENKVGSYATEEAAALDILKRKNPQLASQIEARFYAGGDTPNGVVSPIDKRQQQQYGTYNSYLNEIQRGRQDELQSDLVKGDLKPSDYANRMGNLSAFTITATRQMAALVGETGKLPKEFDSVKDAYGAFLDIASSGNQELINQLNQQVQAVAYYDLQLKNWKQGTPITNQSTGEVFTPDNMKQIEQLRNDARNALASSTAYGQQQVRLQNLKVQDVYGGNVNPTASETDINKVIASTQKIQNRRYSDLDPQDYAALKESWEPFKVLVEEAGKVFYKEISGIDKSIFGENFQAMQESGQISSTSNGLGFSQLDITRPQLDQAVTKANALTKQLEGKGYKSNVEDVLIATSDEQISKQHVDMKILQYIMQQILDTEKKQLEGVYNLPEGATAFVPYSAALLAPGAGLGTGEGGDGFGLKNPTVDVPNTSTKEATIDNWWAKQYGGQKIPDNYIKEAITTSVKDVDTTPKKEYFSPSEEGVSSNRSANMSNGDETSSLMSVFSQFIDNLRGMLMPQQAGIGGGIKGGDDLKSIRGSAQGSASEVSTKLDLRLTSTTQLIVDGRMLASIIKPYLAADLLKTNESGGTVTRSYVI